MLALRSRGLGAGWTAHLHREREMAELLRLRMYSGRTQATGLVPERTSRPGSADVASPKR